MADSHNTTTLPVVTRRGLIAGAAALSTISIVPSAAAATTASTSELQTLMERYREAEAMQRQADAKLDAAEATLAPHRDVRDAAKKALQMAIEEARTNYTYALSRDPAARSSLAQLWPEGATTTEGASIVAKFLADYLSKALDEDAVVQTARAHLHETEEALAAASRRLDWDRLNVESDQIGEARSVIVDEIEVAHISSINEFAAKIEFLATVDPDTSHQMPDVLDLLMIHAEDLGITHQLAPETATLSRNINWWGPRPNREEFAA